MLRIQRKRTGLPILAPTTLIVFDLKRMGNDTFCGPAKKFIVLSKTGQVLE